MITKYLIYRTLTYMIFATEITTHVSPLSGPSPRSSCGTSASLSLLLPEDDDEDEEDEDDHADDHDHDHDCSCLQFDDINLFFTLLVIGEVDKPVSSVSD